MFFIATPKKMGQGRQEKCQVRQGFSFLFAILTDLPPKNAVFIKILASFSALATWRLKNLSSYDFSQVSLYSALAEIFECFVIAADEIFEIVLVTSYEAGLLGAKSKSAALLLEIIGYDQNGSWVEYNKSIVRGDKAKLLFHVRRQILNDQETWIQWESSDTRSI